MNQILLALMASLVVVGVQAKQIRVAVIDTGFDFKSTWKNADALGLVKPKLCTSGHKDLTNFGLQDTHGHGTHIAGLIAKYANDSDYCLLIIKFYDNRSAPNTNLTNTIKAFAWAIEQNVDIINYSGGGISYNSTEKQIVDLAIHSGITIMAAAGNEKTEISQSGVGTNPGIRSLAKVSDCSFFPGCYSDFIERIGSVDENYRIAKYSNHGTAVTGWEMGTRVYSLLPNNRYGQLSGTSQATAIRTGKTVKRLYELNKFDIITHPKYLKLRNRELA